MDRLKFTVDISLDGTALERAAAEWLARQLSSSPGRLAVSLSGGSTPQALYRLLVSEPYRSRMPWRRIHIFFGDERFVPHDHPDSNYRACRESLLDHVPVAPEHVHPWITTGDPGRAAAAYADELRAFYGEERLDTARPMFDATLLGLGADGHTASLLPGVDALDDRVAWTAAVTGAAPQTRLTMTYPLLESSRAVAFIVSGEQKRGALRRVLAGDPSLPATHVRAAGELTWLVDEAAYGPSEPYNVIVVTGVSGAGKTTVARGVAAALGWPFTEGDDMHPKANVEKMAASQPLTDEDRAPWLAAIADWTEERVRNNAHGVITCSALKRSYRERIGSGKQRMRIVYLHEDVATLEDHVRHRHHAFFPAALLRSQLATLEPPSPDEPVCTIEVDPEVDRTVARALALLGPPGGARQ